MCSDPLPAHEVRALDTDSQSRGYAEKRTQRAHRRKWGGVVSPLLVTLGRLGQGEWKGRTDDSKSPIVASRVVSIVATQARTSGVIKESPVARQYSDVFCGLLETRCRLYPDCMLRVRGAPIGIQVERLRVPLISGSCSLPKRGIYFLVRATLTDFCHR